MNDTTIAGFAAAFAVPPIAEQERMVEALLFASRTPLTGREIEERLPAGCDVGEALAALRARYAGRGVGLVRAGAGHIGGKGGGGRRDMAQAGGPNGAGAQAALDAIVAALQAA